ncbi:MAG: MATE family efflux transporter, partial [Oscillospiraceae bacterium]
MAMEQSDLFLDRTFRHFLLPTLFSVLGGTVNVMIDSILVGNLMGTEGLAAINLCTPIYLLLCTFGSLIASGGGILSSVGIGRDGAAAGRRYYTLAFWLLLGVGAVFSGLGLLFLDPLVTGLGGTGALRPLVTDYVRITLAGGVFKLLLYLPFHYLRLDGRTNLVTLLLLMMTGINTVLDLFFMAGLGLGMAGAALASVLATAAAVGLGLIFLHQRVSTFHLDAILPTPREIWELLKTGSPSALNNFLSAGRLVLLNHVLLGLGGSAAVSVFTLVSGMGECSLALISGIPQTAAPLLGVYGGERDTRSIRRLLRRQFLTGGGLILLFAIAVALLPALICRLFGAPDLVDLATPALRLFAGSLPLAMLGSILTSYYNTMGHIAVANALTAGRIFVFAVGSAALLTKLSAPIWYFYPLAEGLTLLTLPLLTAVARRGNKALSPLYLLDETLEREGRSLNFSVENSSVSVAEASEKIQDFCESNDFSPQQTMAVSLSIEEMLLLILKNCFVVGDGQTADVRIFSLPGTIGLRIRNGG